MCGENADDGLPPADCGGSSPRVRGKLQGRRHRLPPQRLIPACAGKTWQGASRSPPPRAHPRVCGENAHAIHTLKARDGSSPRVRGKPRPQHRAGHRPGLIPACAGKTMVMVVSPAISWAHPRVCGENNTLPAQADVDAGSSPRVRGKPGNTCTGATPRGLIPACAGKTSTPSAAARRRPAHPRVCGENPGGRCRVLPGDGSSPRVRGKRASMAARRRSRGLIPACAGKTPVINVDVDVAQAHPRVCGENRWWARGRRRRLGSSPRVRGKLRGRRRPRTIWGLIPARAGKTPRSWTTAWK